jgi:hypothetical protein
LALSKSKGVPNASNVRSDCLESDNQVSTHFDSMSNLIGSFELNENIVSNLKLRQEHLTLKDVGDIMLDYGSIYSEL